jgi:DNA mismatch endonuclease (patch repair protein)
MTDVHSPEVRRRNMAAIRANNTQPELMVRKALHALGYRFRLHVRSLPGRPDVVLPRHHAVIFINGCFFHGHQCSYFRWPASRAQFWRKKITDTRERDLRNVADLRVSGWRVLTVWECALRGQRRRRLRALALAAAWLGGARKRSEIGEARGGGARFK